ncbi:hypothetical protein Voc01_079500 [Virgisporangium ochraceum]|uniref:Uncharacterized protein n=1 Tax=Virgisporangium ochraceum TaxID=65505 RepID=A0A8J4EFV1_9ACTN|nr:hypothetical protein Voc01_079500 [Virgisporangium ochraceum]
MVPVHDAGAASASYRVGAATAGEAADTSPAPAGVPPCQRTALRLPGGCADRRGVPGIRAGRESRVLTVGRG